MWPKFIPMYTHGGFLFGGFGRGDVWDNFWGPIAGALTSYVRNPGDYSGFTNPSGKTDRQEDYEWKQHEKAWEEYIQSQVTKEMNKLGIKPTNPNDPWLYFSHRYKYMGVFEWNGKEWVCVRSMYATDKILNWKGTDIPCGVPSWSGPFAITGTADWGDKYGGEVLLTSSKGPTDKDNAIHSGPIEGGCGCIWVSEEDLSWSVWYYWQHVGDLGIWWNEWF